MRTGLAVASLSKVVPSASWFCEWRLIERLAQHRKAIGVVLASGDHHGLYVFADLLSSLRELNSIHLGHINVRDEQGDCSI